MCLHAGSTCCISTFVENNTLHFCLAFAESLAESKKLKSQWPCKWAWFRIQKNKKKAASLWPSCIILQHPEQKAKAKFKFRLFSCFPASREPFQPLFQIAKIFCTLLHISSGREQCSSINSTNKLSAGNDPVVFSLHKYSKFRRINMD